MSALPLKAEIGSRAGLVAPPAQRRPAANFGCSSCYFGYAAALETALFAAWAMSAATACGFET